MPRAPVLLAMCNTIRWVHLLGQQMSCAGNVEVLCVQQHLTGPWKLISQHSGLSDLQVPPGLHCLGVTHCGSHPVHQIPAGIPGQAFQAVAQQGRSRGLGAQVPLQVPYLLRLAAGEDHAVRQQASRPVSSLRFQSPPQALLPACDCCKVPLVTLLCGAGTPTSWWQCMAQDTAPQRCTPSSCWS